MKPLLLLAALPLLLQDSAAYEQSFRASFRPESIRQCVASAQQSSGTSADFTPTCTCMTDHALATKTVQQLSQAPDPQETSRVAAACMASHPSQRR